MLVVSRKKDEAIILQVPGRPNNIEIRVTQIDGKKKVRLGILADKDVIVLREELMKPEQPSPPNN